MNPMNGLLLIDKPTGITSHDVVHRARRILGIRGIGHAGTLDPLASGLLVLLIGEATKVSDYLLNGDKGYELGLRLGIKTDSMDITGQLIRESSVDVSAQRVREVVAMAEGLLELEVPAHSAVKVDGRKLYEFAHRGEKPEHLPRREMRFYDVGIESLDLPRVRVSMKCSKGSFVRAWANHVGDELGCGACVETLRRSLSEPFKVESAIGLEELEERWNAKDERHGRALGSAWVPLKDALPHFRRVDIAGQDERLLKNGQISGDLRALLLQGVALGQSLPSVRVVSRETDDLLALLVAEAGQFYKIRRVFHRA